MPFTTALGALLGGAATEAAQVHQERFQQDQANKKLAFDTLTHLIDDPNIGNPAIKEEALQEIHGRLMGEAHPDAYSHKPGKLGKLVDQFVGMQTPPLGPLGHPMQQGGVDGNQPGVGRGNATTQVGGATPQGGGQQGPPPAPPDASAGSQPQSGGPPQPSFGMQAGPPSMPDWLQDGPEDVTPSGFRTQKGQEKIGMRQEWGKAHIQALANVQQAQEANKVTLGFDIGQFKKGDVIDARMLPMIDTVIKATMPEAESSSITTPEGHKLLKLTDKNPRSETFGKELSTVDLGETAEIARSGPTELVRAFQRDNGRPPNQKEALGLMSEYEKMQAGTRQPFQINVGTAIANAKENAQKDLYGTNDPDTVDAYTDDIFNGRQTIQQIPAAGGLRSAVQRAFKERVTSGEKPPIPLTTEGASAVATTQPILQMVQRLRNGILPYAKSNTPLGTAGDSLLYNMGISTDSSGNIANAELLRVLGGARVIKGASRSVVALEQAMTHLPNIKKDSGKLMYEKLDNLESNLKDVVNSAYMYEGKYGAGQNPVTPPPASKISADDFMQWMNEQNAKKTK